MKCGWTFIRETLSSPSPECPGMSEQSDYLDELLFPVTIQMEFKGLMLSEMFQNPIAPASFQGRVKRIYLNRRCATPFEMLFTISFSRSPHGASVPDRITLLRC